MYNGQSNGGIFVTRTTTGVSHYQVQKTRRAKFLEDWRHNHRDIVGTDDVALHRSERGSRVGVYVGADGDRPTRTMDALAHEFDPGTTTTVHRHSWDAMVFVVAGWGWTEIDGVRIEWGPGDSLHLPAWSWHRSGNDGTETARYLSFSSEPMLDTMGMAMVEDAGHTPRRTARTTRLHLAPGRTTRTRAGCAGSAANSESRRAGRLHTSWDDLELINTPRGTRTTFLLDRAIGYQASGITMAMFEIGPAGASRCTGTGEAWLYVVDGSAIPTWVRSPRAAPTTPGRRVT
jgi:gentisate 1,2-dioxygenase